MAFETSGSRAHSWAVVSVRPPRIACTIRSRTGCPSNSKVSTTEQSHVMLPFAKYEKGGPDDDGNGSGGDRRGGCRDGAGGALHRDRGVVRPAAASCGVRRDPADRLGRGDLRGRTGLGGRGADELTGQGGVGAGECPGDL